MKRLLQIALVVLFSISVAGCGSDGNSETNGTLSLSAAAPVNAGVANLTATAVLTPVLTGSKVDFTVVQYGFNSGSGTVETFPTYYESQHTDSTGTAVIFHNFNQQTFATTLEVTASSGGLHQTVRIPVAAAVP